MNIITKKFRTIVLAGLTGLASIGATAALPAAPASAATSVTFCFTFQNPPTFTTYANRPVYMYEELPHGDWTLTRSGTTDSRGCGTFYNTNPTVKIAIRAYISTAYQTWDGWAPYWATSGSGRANVGTGYVWRTR